VHFSISVRWLLSSVVVFAAALAAGCSTDREQTVIGKWKGDKTSAAFAAIKIKEESGASVEDARNAAKLLAATFVELRKDKTFTAGMGGATTDGNWTFNKETGEVILNISKMKGPDGKELEAGAPTAWTAYLDDGDQRLAFYPAPPESVAMIKKSGETGGLTNGISLYKR